MKTFMANPAAIERKWYVVDAEDAGTPGIRGRKHFKRQE